MKKKSILNLIKYYSEENDAGFRSEAYEIAKDFDESGDYQLAEYIMALMSNANTFVPQMSENDSALFEKIFTVYGFQIRLHRIFLELYMQLHIKLE